MLVEPDYKWKSFAEPTARDLVERKAEKQEEDEANGQEPHLPWQQQTKRYRRSNRQFNMRDRYRVWADTILEASVVGWT